MTDHTELSRTIDAIVREDRGQLLAALISALRDFDLAEDALSDAIERALVHWSRNGIPNSPKGWLLQVARRRAIDRLRHGQMVKAKRPDIEMLMAEDEADRAAEPSAIQDERLRLIFTCCHPALDEKSRVALTLRTIAGLTTREIARAFLDTEVAMGQRLSRAKAKIGAAAIPYSVPEPEIWDERLTSVLTVIYLIFNEGWTAGPGQAPIRDTLCDEAIFLARTMNGLAPNEPEIEALLALVLLIHSRRKARSMPGAALVPLDKQDRSLWDAGMVKEGLGILDNAVGRGRPGPFQFQAAIHGVHATAKTPKETDWDQIVLLYDRLHDITPSSVVWLNRCVALAETGALTEARGQIQLLSSDLEGYQPYHAARAELSARAGDTEDALIAFDHAIKLSKSENERAWLATRRASLV